MTIFSPDPHEHNLYTLHDYHIYYYDLPIIMCIIERIPIMTYNNLFSATVWKNPITSRTPRPYLIHQHKCVGQGTLN